MLEPACSDDAVTFGSLGTEPLGPGPELTELS
ncbi:MAG: hypothetical protein QOH53_1422, partial [Ilumatobacteraceae bacterium]